MGWDGVDRDRVGWDRMGRDGLEHPQQEARWGGACRPRVNETHLPTPQAPGPHTAHRATGVGRVVSTK